MLPGEAWDAPGQSLGQGHAPPVAVSARKQQSRAHLPWLRISTVDCNSLISRSEILHLCGSGLAGLWSGGEDFKMRSTAPMWRPGGLGAAEVGPPHGLGERRGPGAWTPGAQGLSGSRSGGCGLLAAALRGRNPGSAGLREERPRRAGCGSVTLGRSEAGPWAGQLDVIGRTEWTTAGGCSRFCWAVWRCGFCSPDAAAWEEQRPGPSGIRAKSRGVHAGCVVCGGCGAHDARGTVAREEAESDVSLEEGELRNSVSEAEWWEQKGRGDSNPVRKSFQVAEHLLGRPGGRQKERAGGEVWTVQKRPPLLSPGKGSSCSMVSVASEAREESVRLLNEAYRKGVIKHNEEVDKNRYILSKLIDCVKFCGAFELALRGHDETEESLNPGVFRGLVDFVSNIDSAMEAHLKSATVFKGTSETIQNELLDCMLEVTKETIVQQ
ncbi:hypothetical protein NDU88_002615 [Pleurodeles waltl]|uniref:DUF4371 domain-containing protein n=1 Tax=Pleurodeles waltl TaxID=8319 RepID=A0AAV7UY44_PLEWA|nr:hypothetical protein NDU88_002615 [Pleurodeles waltl]